MNDMNAPFRPALNRKLYIKSIAFRLVRREDLSDQKNNIELKSSFSGSTSVTRVIAEREHVVVYFVYTVRLCSV